MSKIYKDYENQYVANNVIYVATMPSECKTISGKPIVYAFASEESCVRNGRPLVNAVKIDKDALLDRFLNGAIVCDEHPGYVSYCTPISAEIHETSKQNGDGFTEITMLSGTMKVHLVSSEAVLDKLVGDGSSSSSPDVS